MTLIYILLAGLIGYFCGAIPFGWIYVKLKTGKDIRDVASGRTGGTNSLRAAGLGVGLATSLSDVAKGAMAIIITRSLLGDALGDLLPWANIFAGSMSVIGHNYSVFMGWRGGAGTGPNVGWASAIWWPMFPIGFVFMASMLYFVGMASVASLGMAVIIPVTFFILYLTGFDASIATLANGDVWVYILGGLITAGIVAWALRPNIKRVLNGEERIVGRRAKKMQKKQQQKQASQQHSSYSRS